MCFVDPPLFWTCESVLASSDSFLFFMVILCAAKVDIKKKLTAALQAKSSQQVVSNSQSQKQMLDEERMDGYSTKTCTNAHTIRLQLQRLSGIVSRIIAYPFLHQSFLLKIYPISPNQLVRLLALHIQVESTAS